MAQGSAYERQQRALTRQVRALAKEIYAQADADTDRRKLVADLFRRMAVQSDSAGAEPDHGGRPAGVAPKSIEGHAKDVPGTASPKRGKGLPLLGEIGGNEVEEPAVLPPSSKSRSVGSSDTSGAALADASNSGTANSALPVSRDGAPLPTSQRQQQVLDRLLHGDSEKQIARRLGISHHTVHVHVKALYAHYGVSSRGELLARFVTRPEG